MGFIDNIRGFFSNSNSTQSSQPQINEEYEKSMLADKIVDLVNKIKKIDSFDNEEFLMNTTMGYIVIKGHGLEIIKLDTYQGNVSIKGTLDSLNYVEHASKKEESDNLFTKLFKWA